MLCSDDLSMTDLAPPVAGSGAAATPSKEAVIPAEHGLSVSGLADMAVVSFIPIVVCHSPNSTHVYVSYYIRYTYQCQCLYYILLLAITYA